MIVSFSVATPIYYDNLNVIRINHNDFFFFEIIDCPFIHYHLIVIFTKLHASCYKLHSFLQTRTRLRFTTLVGGDVRNIGPRHMYYVALILIVLGFPNLS